jgi:hypothetical protein
MDVLDKLRKVGNYVLRAWRYTAADSYSHYKRGRERARKQEERGREDAERFAEQERRKARRGSDYEERYAAERATEEPQTEAPRDDTSKPK